MARIRHKNNEPPTSCIKHLAVSGLSSVPACIKSSCNLIGNRFEMPNVSYTQTLCTILGHDRNKHKTTELLYLKKNKING